MAGLLYSLEILHLECIFMSFCLFFFDKFKFKRKWGRGRHIVTYRKFKSQFIFYLFFFVCFFFLSFQSFSSEVYFSFGVTLLTVILNTQSGESVRHRLQYNFFLLMMVMSCSFKKRGQRGRFFEVGDFLLVFYLVEFIQHRLMLELLVSCFRILQFCVYFGSVF